MAHTRNQELESRFNTLQSGLLETQKEVQQLSATIASRDASMHASVNVVVQSAMVEVKHELTSQMESVFAALCTKLNSLTGFFAPQTLKLIGYIKHRKVIILVDSGSTHNFIHRPRNPLLYPCCQ